MTVMDRYTHKPRRGDKFYDQAQDQPNGKIIMVDWEDREVTVEFLDANQTRKQYDFDEIEDYYDSVLFGGGYYIYNRVSKLT